MQETPPSTTSDSTTSSSTKDNDLIRFLEENSRSFSDGIDEIRNESAFDLTQHVSDQIAHELEELPKPEREDKTLEDDFLDAQANIRDLITKGGKALNQLMILAGASDNPRAYEVLNQLITTLGNLSKDTIDLHQKRAEVNMKNNKLNGGQPTNVTNNNLIVGSMAEMLDMISSAQKPPIDHEE